MELWPKGKLPEKLYAVGLGDRGDSWTVSPHPSTTGWLTQGQDGRGLPRHVAEAICRVWNEAAQRQLTE